MNIANQLAVALRALLVHAQSELEQRQNCGNDEEWGSLESDINAASAALAAHESARSANSGQVAAIEPANSRAAPRDIYADAARMLYRETRHTREPWHADDGMISMDDQAAILPRDWCAIATGDCMNDGESVVCLTHPDNARRIVACVNACAGLETAELESGGMIALQSRGEG